MTERLSDERLHHILREYTDDCGWEVNAGEVGDMTEELFALRAENAHLRQRCAWLQERREALRRLVAARWSKRREVRRLRAKLAAGPVMPEVPQSELVLDELSRVMRWERAIEMYADIRTALLKEQSR